MNPLGHIGEGAGFNSLFSRRCSAHRGFTGAMGAPGRRCPELFMFFKAVYDLNFTAGTCLKSPVTSSFSAKSNQK